MPVFTESSGAARFDLRTTDSPSKKNGLGPRLGTSCNHERGMSTLPSPSKKNGLGPRLGTSCNHERGMSTLPFSGRAASRSHLFSKNVALSLRSSTHRRAGAPTKKASTAHHNPLRVVVQVADVEFSIPRLVASDLRRREAPTSTSLRESAH